jgi:hypothetical protein
MSDHERNHGHAYLRVRAREANARGDAVVDALPFVPDLIRPRGFAFDGGTVVTKKTVTRGTEEVPLDQLEGAIAKLVEELRPNTNALRSLRDQVRMRLTVVAYPESPWKLRLTSETIAWLTEIDAALWIDAFLGVPEGTENGPICGFCKIERPSPDCEELVDLLGGWGPHHGIADARLVMSLDHASVLRIFDRWTYLAAALDDMGVSVLAGKPWATTPRRDGAAAVSILLRRLHKNRTVWRALRSGNETALEIRARHWSNVRHAGAWLRRRALRRLARLGAVFHYQIIPDLKPSFEEDGSCNHCAYVQPWSTPDDPQPIEHAASVDQTDATASQRPLQ